MKKRLLLLISMLCIVLSCFSAYAATESISYTSISVLEQNRGSITGQKSSYQTNIDGGYISKVTLVGSFTFNGTSASCINASCDVTIYNDAWSTKSVSAYTSGNSAVAEVTIVRKLLFIILETKNVTITLSCDRYGNLS